MVQKEQEVLSVFPIGFFYVPHGQMLPHCCIKNWRQGPAKSCIMIINFANCESQKEVRTIDTFPAGQQMILLIILLLMFLFGRELTAALFENVDIYESKSGARLI